jgi:hypothetical protein
VRVLGLDEAGTLLRAGDQQVVDEAVMELREELGLRCGRR